MLKALANRLCSLLFHGRERILKPFPAALFLGLVVVASLLWFGKGVHVSGVFAVLCETDSSKAISHGDSLFCSPNAPHEDRTWMFWMVGGVFVGAAMTSFLRLRRLKFQIERGLDVNPKNRLISAAAGGAIVGLGAAIAGGCTSSLGLTGASLLTIAGFAFLAAFFIGGFASRIWFGRMWQ